MDWFSLGWIGLFGICFLSATLLPFSSEAVLLAFLYAGYDPFVCLTIATLGNTVGGSTNYFIGRLGKVAWFTKFGLSEKRLEHFSARVEKRGFLLAIFAWVPIIGDPLMIVLGIFKTPIWSTFMLMLVGKAVRYGVIIYVYFETM